jgi:hypothetical protein
MPLNTLSSVFETSFLVFIPLVTKRVDAHSFGYMLASLVVLKPFFGRIR